MRHEDMHTEFKREFVEEFKNTVIAFANTEGGEIFFGIEDDGNVCGIQNTDDTITKITNSLRDSIHPDITLFTKCEFLTIENKTVIKLSVQKGVSRPYFLASKGIRSAGVFVRQGASTVNASESAILQMIRESSGEKYEDGISPEQNLSFSQSEVHFKSKEVEFNDVQKKSLGMIRTDGSFSNLALLLSDQCPHIIKIAVFQGSTKTLFKDRREFSGSVLKQLEDAFSFLDMYNHLHAEVHGLERIDTPDYPGDAIRETLLNVLVHRDYAMQSPALISIFDDRMEFVSIGGLVSGISYDDILLGISMCRNPRLSNVFYRLQLIEAYGTGIMKMHEGYRDFDVQPKIEVSTHAFKVTLPNVNFEGNKPLAYGTKAVYNSPFKIKDATTEYSAPRQYAQNNANVRHYGFSYSYGADITQYSASRYIPPEEYRENLLMELFSQNESVSRKDVEMTLHTSQANAVLILRKLLEEGKITKTGSGRNVRYMKNNRS